MKRYLIAAAFLIGISAAAFAADQTWSGTISDKMCGASHKAMGSKLPDRDCTLACTKEGTPYVLLTAGTVFQLSGHETDLKAHAGHAVKITGELKGDAIRVSRVEMPKQ